MARECPQKIRSASHVWSTITQVKPFLETKEERNSKVPQTPIVPLAIVPITDAGSEMFLQPFSHFSKF